MESRTVTSEMQRAREGRKLCASLISDGSMDLAHLAAYRHYITVSMMLGDLTHDQAVESIKTSRLVFEGNVHAWMHEHRSLRHAVASLGPGTL